MNCMIILRNKLILQIRRQFERNQISINHEVFFSLLWSRKLALGKICLIRTKDSSATKAGACRIISARDFVCILLSRASSCCWILQEAELRAILFAAKRLVSMNARSY